MTIIQLEYLVAVANHGSFSLAAEKCFCYPAFVEYAGEKPGGGVGGHFIGPQ